MSEIVTTPAETVARWREIYPLGYWPETRIHIEREGWHYVVRQRKRFIGRRRTYIGAIKLVQEAGGR